MKAVVGGYAYELGIVCMVKGQVLVRGHRTEQEAAAVGLRTSSCLVWGRRWGRRRTTIILPLLLCLLWKPSPQIQGIECAIQSIGFERWWWE